METANKFEKEFSIIKKLKEISSKTGYPIIFSQDEMKFYFCKQYTTKNCRTGKEKISLITIGAGLTEEDVKNWQ